MTTAGGTLMLLDTASLYFRAFHGVPSSITAPDGTPVNAVRGLLDMIAHLVTTRRPDRLVACWDDDWRPAFRVAAVPSYKAHRVANPSAGTEQTPHELEAQIPTIEAVLAAVGIPRVGAPGYEADDVIGTLATRAADAGGSVVEIVSGDRDLFQLVDDERSVRVLYVGRGVRKLEVVDEAWLRAKYGVSGGDGYADLAVLRGDTSDGLPGVAGIGEKTAAALLERHGSLVALRAAAEDPGSGLAPGVRRKLIEAAAYLDVAPAVVRVARDAELRVHPGPKDDRVPREPADPQALIDLVRRWGIDSSVQRLLMACGWTPDPG